MGVKQFGMNPEPCHWKPSEILSVANTGLSYALLVLNTPIAHRKDYFLSLWEKASIRVTVDGGTNRWHKFTSEHQCERCPLPDMITGDLDSIAPDVLKYYQSLGVDVIRTLDQNETDFTKALREVLRYMGRKHFKLDAVVALAESAGRLDQIVANINTLFKAEVMLAALPVFLLGCNSLTWLLQPGLHHISVPPDLLGSGSWCSLVPFGAPATVTTTGLKWNLNDQVMQFGTLVSTSNTYSGVPLVTIQTDKSIVWSMGLNLPAQKGSEETQLLLECRSGIKALTPSSAVLAHSCLSCSSENGTSQRSPVSILCLSAHHRFVGAKEL